MIQVAVWIAAKKRKLSDLESVIIRLARNSEESCHGAPWRPMDVKIRTGKPNEKNFHDLMNKHEFT